MKEQRTIDWLENMKRNGRNQEDTISPHSRRNPKPETIEFLNRLKYGEESEKRLITYLTNLGATVKNISTDIMPEGYLSPFDLLAKFPSSDEYVVDCKHWKLFPNEKRRFRDYILVPSYHIPRWEAYETKATKLLLFEVVSPHHIYFRMFDTLTVDWLYLRTEDVVKKGTVSFTSEHYKISKTHLRLFRRFLGEEIE